MPGFSRERLARVDTFIAEATRRDFLGAVTLVARDGKVVAWRAHGHRDLARSTPLVRDDIFAVYSLTKPLLTAAVMVLVDEGRVDLDAPVKDYLPAIARVWSSKPMTVRQLLTHTAGFGADTRKVEHDASDLAGYVEAIATLHLAYEPGTRFGYHSGNSEVAARLVEVVSGQRFGEFLRQRLLEPLGMEDTGFTVPEAKRHRIAAMTTHDAKGRLIAASTGGAAYPGGPLRRWESGAGGLYSTPGDFARFGQMMLDRGTFEGRRILSERSVAAMMTNQLTFLDPPVSQYGEGFGLGGFVNLDRPRERPGSVGAWGWSGAAGTYLMVDPKERLVAMLFTQSIPQDDLPRAPKRLSMRFYNLVYQSLER